MPFIKRAAFSLCLCLSLLLTACGIPAEVMQAFSPVDSEQAAAPDLRLLTRPPYRQQEQIESGAVPESVLRVDLWLDASQVMGGVNPSAESMYPHTGRKYREGGFHYRYQNTVGMYEGVLRCLLASAEGSRVRILRCGNERLPDDYLRASGVASADADADALRSLRRDMLTFAIDPMPSVFASFSGESMEDSFYSLGSPMLSRVGSLNRTALENPDRQQVMQTALTRQREAILAGDASDLLAVNTDGDYPLLYALENLDPSRLSVITCDPAAIRRLTDVRSDGTPVHRVEEVLRNRGVFDAGRSVTLYALTLDYMGQIASFGSADFSEPILWGRLKYSDRTHQSTAALPMPRTFIMLVIGQPAQVKTYTAALDRQFAASPALRGLRGPEKGELSYVQNGQTVTQQPFAFESQSAVFARPDVPCSTQQTQGVSLASAHGSVSREGSLTTVTLSPDEAGKLSDDVLTLTLPLPALPEGVKADLTKLKNLSLLTETALLWDRTLPATHEAVIGDTEQTIALRDKVYVFSRMEQPFAAAPESDPFSILGVALEGDKLKITMSADGQKLRPGYCRLQLSADLSGEEVTWPSIPWTDALNCDLTNEQIAEWEAFTGLITQYERKRDYVPKQFQHAWGALNERGYRGTTIPDLPPVMRAHGLSELIAQLQAAANVDTVPFLRYTFDVFVTGGDMSAREP